MALHEPGNDPISSSFDAVSINKSRLSVLDLSSGLCDPSIFGKA